MTTDLVFSICSGMSLILGFAGAFLPVLPGPPLAWLGILLAFFSSYNQISLTCLIITAVIAVIATASDALLPSLMTKKFGGSKAATTGCTIGLIIGLICGGPFGIIIGPFVGALIGELGHTNGEAKKSFKSAMGAFLGFISGCGIKALTAVCFLIIFALSFKFKI